MSLLVRALFLDALIVGLNLLIVMQMPATPAGPPSDMSRQEERAADDAAQSKWSHAHKDQMR